MSEKKEEMTFVRAFLLGVLAIMVGAVGMLVISCAQQNIKHDQLVRQCVKDGYRQWECEAFLSASIVMQPRELPEGKYHE